MYRAGTQTKEAAVSQKIGISIGDISISATCDDPAIRLLPDNAQRRFISDDRSDLSLKIRYGNTRLPDSAKPIFNSGTYWSSFEDRGRLAFSFRLPSAKEPYSLAVIEPSCKSGHIYMSKSVFGLPSIKGRQSVPPLMHPLDQLLMAHLLAKRHGVIAHACGVEHKGKGLLFVGVSGAGKSTMAKLWKNEMGSKILNDDRIALRKIGTRFYIYGTPWHGDVNSFSPNRAPLAKIFFLKQSHNNRARKLGALDSASRLFVRSFPAFWDKDGMDSALRFCANASEELPAYELEFLPDKSIVNFIKKHRDL